MKVLVNGQLIEYKDEGKGKTIVLLHGWGSTLSAFDELTRFLTKSYRVVRLDFPGFGGSPRPSDDWTVDSYARLTAAFLKKLDIVSVYAIMGHSFGGRVIIKSISKGYLDPEKVILFGAAGIKSEQQIKKSVYKLIAKTGKAVTSLPGLKALQPILRRRLYESAGATDYLNAEAMRPIFLNTINEDLTDLLGDISQPTLMVWGENDSEVPVKDAETMHGLIKHSQLIIVPGAGHFVFTDDAIAVQKEIGVFL
ncbi:MAG: alpha/beta hydrolase [Candidatus Microsaccharimonas sp.]